MSKFGIVAFENGKQVVCHYHNATSIKTLAIEHLKSLMEEEGYQVNDLGGYLKGWADSISEIREDNGEEAVTDVTTILDEIADNLAFTNTQFITLAKDGVWESLSNEQGEELFEAIYDTLKEGFGDDAQVDFVNKIKGTQFEKDLIKPMGGVGTLGAYNLIVSIRDCKLWERGMKPTRSWKVTSVKKYFGIKGSKETLAPQLQAFLDVVSPKKEEKV